jgi:hypothetical protein
MRLHETKGFCTAKEMVTSYISDKELISRICRVLKNLISQRINNLLIKWQMN